MNRCAPLQWLGSGENKIVATAQLKLLLSFTTIPALACTAAPSVASDSGYDSSCSSSSSQDSLCSNDKSSAMMPSRLETAQEGPDSRESSHAEPRQASQLPASREPRQDRSGSLKRRQQQQHASESQEHVQRLPAKPTAALDSAASQLSAAPPHAAKMALGDEAKAAAKEAAEGSRQDKPAPAAGTTGEGEAPGLSPEEALSRLIHRAEQLRQMIAGAPADSSSSSAAIAKTGTETFQHCIKSDADVFSAPTAGHEGLGADTSLPAMSSTNTDKQHTRHSTTPAGNSTATGDTDSGNPIVDSTEQTQSSISMDSAPTSVKQKTMNDRVLPVSKLRKVAQGRSGSVAKDRTLSPQKTAASSLPKVRPYHSSSGMNRVVLHMFNAHARKEVYWCERGLTLSWVNVCLKAHMTDAWQSHYSGKIAAGFCSSYWCAQTWTQPEALQGCSMPDHTGSCFACTGDCSAQQEQLISGSPHC